MDLLRGLIDSQGQISREEFVQSLSSNLHALEKCFPQQLLAYRKVTVKQPGT
jgi:hypothetical protein